MAVRIFSHEPPKGKWLFKYLTVFCPERHLIKESEPPRAVSEASPLREEQVLLKVRSQGRRISLSRRAPVSLSYH